MAQFVLIRHGLLEVTILSSQNALEIMVSFRAIKYMWTWQSNSYDSPRNSERVKTWFIVPWSKWKPHCSSWVSSFKIIWSLLSKTLEWTFPWRLNRMNSWLRTFSGHPFTKLWPCLSLILVVHMTIKNPIIHNSPTMFRTLKCLQLVPCLSEAFELHIGDLCQGNRLAFAGVLKLRPFSCGHSDWMKEYPYTTETNHILAQTLLLTWFHTADIVDIILFIRNLVLWQNTRALKDFILFYSN